MTVGNQIQKKEFTLKANPVYQCTIEDYQAQYLFLIDVKNKFTEVQDCISNIRILRGQIEQFKSIGGEKIPTEIASKCDTILKKISWAEGELYQVKLKSGQDILNFPMKINDRLSGLYNYASSGNTAPNQQVKQAFSELSNLADAVLKNFDSIVQQDVYELNKLIKTSELKIIGIPEKDKN
jgi:hypothetical protein